MQDFRNLKVWQKAHNLTLLIYKLTADFPRDEIFGLRNSLRKTCVDIPAFIAEGSGKSNDADFSRSLTGAMALAHRLEHYALLAFDLKHFSQESHKFINSEIVELRKMLIGFNRTLIEHVP
jgi:four helix bundle protein